jgi:hypothetical protein
MQGDELVKYCDLYTNIYTHVRLAERINFPTAWMTRRLLLQSNKLSHPFLLQLKILQYMASISPNTHMRRCDYATGTGYICHHHTTPIRRHMMASFLAAGSSSSSACSGHRQPPLERIVSGLPRVITLDLYHGSRRL